MNKTLEEYSKFALYVETEARWFRPIAGQRYAAGSPLFGHCPLEAYRYIREGVMHVRLPTLEDYLFEGPGVEIVGVAVAPRFVGWTRHWRRCWYLTHEPGRLDGIDAFKPDEWGGYPVAVGPGIALPTIRQLSETGESDREIFDDEREGPERQRDYVLTQWAERAERRAHFAKLEAEARRKAS